MRTAGLLAFVVMLGSLGIACLFFTGGVQGFALRWIERGVTSRIHVARSFMQSASYLVSIKAVGVIALLCAAFLLWAFIRSGIQVAR